jgi:replication factor C subunit 3/5
MASAAQDLGKMAALEDQLAGSKGKSKVDQVLAGRDAPWVEKYRPKTLDDVAAHKEIIDTSECGAIAGGSAPRLGPGRAR